MTTEQRTKLTNTIIAIISGVVMIGYFTLLLVGVGQDTIPPDIMEQLPPEVLSTIAMLNTIAGRSVIGGVSVVTFGGVVTKILYSRSAMAKLKQDNTVQHQLNADLQSRLDRLEKKQDHFEQRVDLVENTTSEALQSFPNAKTKAIAKRLVEKPTFKEVVEQVEPVVEKVVKVVKKARK